MNIKILLFLAVLGLFSGAYTVIECRDNSGALVATSDCDGGDDDDDGGNNGDSMPTEILG